MQVTWGRFSGYTVSVLALAALVLSACGGGGATSAAGSPVASYIADGLAPGFEGIWFKMTISATSSVVGADTTSLATTATANSYALTNTGMRLTNGAWANAAPYVSTNYELTPAGWALEATVNATFTDSGDGTNATLLESNGTVIPVTLAMASLDGTAIPCGGTACVVPGNYPAGSTRYTMKINTDYYRLNSQTTAATDATGALLTALPALNTTFCNVNRVYAPIAGAAAGANNYNIYSLPTGGSCTAAAITTALATAPTGNALISTVATNNTAVPNVLRVTNLVGTSIVNNTIFAVRAGNVWAGIDVPAGQMLGGYGVMVGGGDNKTAINAQLAAYGFAPMP